MTLLTPLGQDPASVQCQKHAPLGHYPEIKQLIAGGGWYHRRATKSLVAGPTEPGCKQDISRGADRRSSLTPTSFSRDILRTNLILKLSAGTIRLFLFFFFSFKKSRVNGKNENCFF